MSALRLQSPTAAPSRRAVAPVAAVALSLLALAAFAPSAARAQGCVAVRLDAPGVGALPGCQGQGYGNKWELATTWRYFESDKHFRGTHYERNRTEEGSQVINTVHQLDVALRRNINDRWSLTVDVPFVDMDRSGPLRDSNRNVVARVERGGGSGLGDISVVARRWMLDPSKHASGNFSLGFGVKLPTGEKDHLFPQTEWNDVNGDDKVDDGELELVIETVDQSVQPGDGGLGFYMDLQAFQSWRQGGINFYAALTYLANPETTDWVPTYRSREPEKYMSIADQYIGRMGVVFTGPGWHGLAVGIGGRIEGVPVHDLFGSSEHFRRPGYSVSVEPSLTWSNGVHSLGVTVPIAVQRNRQRSVPDMQVGPDRHGDAAFADYSVIVSYSYRFGRGKQQAMMEHGM